jgi:hypothetical protein
MGNKNATTKEINEEEHPFFLDFIDFWFNEYDSMFLRDQERGIIKTKELSDYRKLKKILLSNNTPRNHEMFAKIHEFLQQDYREEIIYNGETMYSMPATCSRYEFKIANTMNDLQFHLYRAKYSAKLYEEREKQKQQFISDVIQPMPMGDGPNLSNLIMEYV